MTEKWRTEKLPRGDRRIRSNSLHPKAHPRADKVQRPISHQEEGWRLVDNILRVLVPEHDRLHNRTRVKYRFISFSPPRVGSLIGKWDLNPVARAGSRHRQRSISPPGLAQLPQLLRR